MKHAVARLIPSFLAAWFLTALGVLVTPVSAVAAAYYVDSARGNDSNSGTSIGSAWRSLDKVNSFRFAPGDDVLLRSGSVFEDQKLIVSWSGTPTDWVRIGCYESNGSGGEVACSSTSVLPEINGTYETSCATSGRCAIGTPEAVPSGHDSGLIVSRSNYFILERIALKDSAANPLVVTGKNGGRREYFIIQDMHIAGSMKRIMLINGEATEGIIRRVHGEQYGLCKQNRHPYCVNGGWSGGIVVADAPNAKIVIEENFVHDGFGEGINCLRSSHLVIRNNRVGNVHSDGIYLDNCSNSIVERNLIWGDTGNVWGSDGRFGAINVSMEDYRSRYIRSAVNNTIRNNLVTGYGSCIVGTQWPNAGASGYAIGFHAYGNSCVAMKNGNFRLQRGTQRVSRTLVQNNLFYSPEASSASCARNGSGEMQFVSNFWDDHRTSERCRGLGDRIGNPGLITSMAVFEHGFTAANPPSARLFALSNTSGLLSGGNEVREGGFIELGELPHSVVDPTQRCSVRREPLTEDFHCSRRGATPAIGALDRFSYPPRSPQVILD